MRRRRRTTDRTSRLRRRSGAALLFLAVLIGGTSHPVEARSLAIERFEARIVVSPAGHMLVREMITFHFDGEWNGVYRTIPVYYPTPRGFSYHLRIDAITATSDLGTSLTTETRRKDQSLEIKIWVPQAVVRTRTIALEYRVENGLRFFDDHDELYWNVTGDQWDVPVGPASVEVVLPDDVQGIRAAAFDGVSGSTMSAADVEIVSPAVTVRMRRGLLFHEGLTVVIGWNKGIVRESSAVGKSLLFLRYNWPFNVPIVLFLGMAGVWWRSGRDPRFKPIVACYEPPDGLTPAEVGTLVDDSPDPRDVTATLVDLAVRGYLRIVEKEEARLFGLWTGKDYVLELRKPRGQWAGLLAHEQLLLEGVFAHACVSADGANPSVELSDLQNNFYRALPGIKEQVVDRLVARGYYARRPDRTRVVFRNAALGVGVLGVVTHVPIERAFETMHPATMLIVTILSGAIIFGFGWLMPARTALGTSVLADVLGFAEFLKRVERDRMQRVALTPDMFDRFLPYAIALGIEGTWAKAFADIYKEPPDWYHGSSAEGFRPGSFSTQSFASSLGDMSSAAGAAMASAPRGSDESGFSGGHSGGGFGGGGGGGF